MCCEPPSASTAVITQVTIDRITIYKKKGRDKSIWFWAVIVGRNNSSLFFICYSYLHFIISRYHPTNGDGTEWTHRLMHPQRLNASFYTLVCIFYNSSSRSRIVLLWFQEKELCLSTSREWEQLTYRTWPTGFFGCFRCTSYILVSPFWDTSGEKRISWYVFRDCWHST